MLCINCKKQVKEEDGIEVELLAEGMVLVGRLCAKCLKKFK
jgi:hypothetical protein